MKKVISGIVAASVVLGGLGTQSAYAASSLQDAINKQGGMPTHKTTVSISSVSNNKLHFKIDGDEVYDNFGNIVTPVLKNGRVLVPFRPLAEYMDANSIKYDNKTNKVTIVRKDKTVEVTNGAKAGLVNGTKKALDEPVQIINGSTYVPLRFVSESLGAKVKWTAKTKTADISVYDFKGVNYYYANSKGEIGSPITEKQAELRYKQGFKDGRELVYVGEIKDLTDNTSRFFINRFGQSKIDGKTYNTSYTMHLDYNPASTKPFTGNYYVWADNFGSNGGDDYFAQEEKKEFNSMQDVYKLTVHDVLQEVGFIKGE